MAGAMKIQKTIDAAIEHHRAGRLSEAELLYRQVIDARPTDHAMLNNLGTVLKKMDRLDEAIELFQKALALRPDFVEAYNNIGNAFKANDQIEESIDAFQHAVALRPRQPEILHNLGMARMAKREYDEAAEVFLEALAIRPNFSEAWHNLGNTFYESGKYVDALDAYRHAVALNPDFLLAKTSLGMTLMALGDYEQGLPLLEVRWRMAVPAEHLARFSNSRPMWDGSNLNGRTLLIHAEQGFGDALQFVRYVPFAADRGAIVILACQPELKRLLSSVGGFSQVATSREQIPLFDVHCPTMSLPFVFKTTLRSIPANVPYLKADPVQSAHWRRRLESYQSTLRIGLCWAGRSVSKQLATRVLTLNALSPLGRVQGATFFSLQKDSPSAEARQPPLGMELIDWTSELHDFADTAALVENLDMVIAPDTAVAHLAGALGKKVWVMLKFAADWRWLIDRADSPWYPSMRLFRQPSIGDWQSVIEQIARELTCLVR